MLRLLATNIAVLAVQVIVVLVVYMVKGNIPHAIFAAVAVAGIACVISANVARSAIWVAYAVLGLGVLEMLSATGSTFDFFLLIAASVGYAAFAAKMEQKYGGAEESFLPLFTMSIPYIGVLFGGTLWLYGRYYRQTPTS